MLSQKLKTHTRFRLLSFRGLALATIAAAIAADVISQEAVSAGETPTEQLIEQDVEGQDSPKEPLLSSLINRAVSSLAPNRSQVSVEVVRVEPGEPATIYLRYSIDWIELVQKVQLQTPADLKGPGAVPELESNLQPKLHLDFLDLPILKQHEANAALGQCDPRLRLSIEKSRPPFFNNWTGIHWIPAKNYLAAEASAVVDAANNRCVKGIVDLRTGEVAFAANEN